MKNKPFTKEFFFLLDAWQYCRMHGLRFEDVKRRDWKTWVLECQK